MKSYYDVLGVEEQSTQEDIKKAFRKLAKEWHPDRSTQPDAHERFQEINEAYQILGNEQKRNEYDHQRMYGSSRSSFSGHPFEDIMEDIFGGGFRRSRTHQQSRQIYTVSCTLEELYTGCTKQVNNRLVNIPKGIRNGTLFQINNDLVRLVVTPHKSFALNGDNIIATVELNAFEAMIGTEVTIEHPDGKEYVFKIPAGTQPESVLRMKGKGMPSPQVPGRFGDFLVACKITIPNDLTDDEKSSIISTGRVKKHNL